MDGGRYHRYRHLAFIRVSYAAEVYGTDSYYSDDCRFATRDEALAYARSRTDAAYRAVVSYDAVNSRWHDGRAIAVKPVPYPYGVYYP